jgi:hypothetical protein
MSYPDYHLLDMGVGNFLWNNLHPIIVKVWNVPSFDFDHSNAFNFVYFISLLSQ